jgi:hypothetical protein
MMSLQLGIRLWNNSNTNVTFIESNTPSDWDEKPHFSEGEIPVFTDKYADTFLGRYTARVLPGPQVVEGFILMNHRVINEYASQRRTSPTNITTSVFSHELGHALGLSDNPAFNLPNNVSLMNHSRDRDVVLGPTDFDVESVNMLYGNSGRTLEAFADAYRNTNVSLIAADFLQYEGAKELSNAATDVVRVRILSERVERINSLIGARPGEGFYNLYTVYEAEVLEVFQGNAAVGDVLEIKQLGGELDGEQVISLDEIPISVGSDLVVFMEKSVIEGNPAFFVNPEQSVYQITDLKTLISFYDDGQALEIMFDGDFQNAFPNSTTTLTFSDLMAIRENCEVQNPPHPLYPSPCDCRNCTNRDFSVNSLILGRVTDNENGIVIQDALQILRLLVGLENVIETCDNARAAANITNPGLGDPSIQDALQILRFLVGLPNLIDGTQT